MNVFINISNHESKKWSEEQLSAAQLLDGTQTGILDMPFPYIDPSWGRYEVDGLAEQFAQTISNMADEYLREYPGGRVYIHIAGELTFCYLLARKISSFCTLVVATTERISTEEVLPDGSTKKTQVFRFVRFRELN